MYMYICIYIYTYICIHCNRFNLLKYPTLIPIFQALETRQTANPPFACCFYCCAFMNGSCIRRALTWTPSARPPWPLPC
jgi:hypothetical protein